MEKMKKLSCIIIMFAIIALLALIIVQKQNSDTTCPVIKFDKDSITASVKDKSTDFLKGVTATDNKDGNVSKTLCVENISDFVKKNTRIITYTAFDSSNNIAKATREIVYTDYASPKFSLTDSPTFHSTDTYIDIAKLVNATDVFDGDITPFIKLVDDNIVLGQSGKYSATVSIYNSAGDCSTINLPIFIDATNYDRRSPSIKLNDYMVYVNKGTTYDYEKNIYSIKESLTSAVENKTSSVIEKVKIDSSNVNFNKAGSYYVTYSYENSLKLSCVTRLVIVVI